MAKKKMMMAKEEMAMAKKKPTCACEHEPDEDDKPKAVGKMSNFGGKKAPPFKAKGKKAK